MSSVAVTFSCGCLPLFKGSQNYMLGLIIYITCRQLWIRWNSLPLVKFKRFWVLF